jgi:hypothetical protein
LSGLHARYESARGARIEPCSEREKFARRVDANEDFVIHAPCATGGELVVKLNIRDFRRLAVCWRDELNDRQRRGLLLAA